MSVGTGDCWELMCGLEHLTLSRLDDPLKCHISRLVVQGSRALLLSYSCPRKANDVDESVPDAGAQRQFGACSMLAPLLPGWR